MTLPPPLSGGQPTSDLMWPRIVEAIQKATEALATAQAVEAHHGTLQERVAGIERMLADLKNTIDDRFTLLDATVKKHLDVSFDELQKRMKRFEVSVTQFTGTDDRRQEHLLEIEHSVSDLRTTLTQAERQRAEDKDLHAARLDRIESGMGTVQSFLQDADRQRADMETRRREEDHDAADRQRVIQHSVDGILTLLGKGSSLVVGVILAQLVNVTSAPHPVKNGAWIVLFVLVLVLIILSLYQSIREHLSDPADAPPGPSPS